jgi:hypothetical protein
MDVPATRATINDTWEGNEQVQVSINDAAAVTYTAAANGTLSPNSPVYWENSSITARAWHPGTFSNVSFQNQSSGFQTIDFIFAATTPIEFADRNTTPLTFRHQTAKVTANLIPGAGVSPSDLTGATVAFFGYTSGTADTDNGTISGSDPDWLTPQKTGNTYTLLLVPQNVPEQQFIKVIIDNIKYYYTPTDAEANLTAGTSYTYNITLSKTGLTVTVVITSATWGAGDSSYVTSTIEP